ncbi:putative amidase [Byssothecium circinans]|uniref:Putative amidase n=1 Tax=Byssothecium circinans TaxID=147558 RepID=A0A6A5TSQ7_9PLEO|nr:putative amidase [Byssothecium circinans]
MPISSQPFAQRWIVQLGSISYLIRNRVEALPPATSPAPVVVISLDTSPISLDTFTSTISRFQTEDDVFNEEFTAGGYLVILQSSDTQPPSTLPSDVTEYLNARSTTILLSKGSLPEGPYFAIGRYLHQAWRLYQSFHGAAFTDSISCVPVPSRLYFKKTEKYPLAGLRITIKDNMHLTGVVTSLGNRAYAELYGKQQTTAGFVELLIQKGAIVIGKTKLSAFAGSEIPPNQCIDYFPPWNARGDGYQGPSGSSSGAASSIAGYPWVDASLCTDTSGSLRHPASSHGAWGHRVTWGALPMEGIVPAVPVYDNIGLLARTPERLQELLAVAGARRSITKPRRLIYPTDWYPVANEAQQKMNEMFLHALEEYFGVEHIKLSLIEECAISVNGYYVYHTFGDFRQDYPAKFGKQPYVSPAHKARWDRGSKITTEERDQSLDRISIFRQWFNKEIWNVEDSGDFAIMIVPQGRPGANYRDVVGEPAGGPSSNSYTPIFTTSMIGCPQLVVPIGQNPYESRVSGLVEYAPIMTSLIGPPGSDEALVEIASGALKKAGWPTDVLTGRFMFAVDDNDRNAKLSPKEKL